MVLRRSGFAQVLYTKSGLHWTSGWESRGVDLRPAQGGLWGKRQGMRASARRGWPTTVCRASFCLALVVGRTTSAHIHGKRPPSRPFIVCMLGAVSVSLTALWIVRRRRLSRADVLCRKLAIHVHLGTFRVWAMCGRVYPSVFRAPRRSSPD